jgi:hypothetical protein
VTGAVCLPVIQTDSGLAATPHKESLVTASPWVSNAELLQMALGESVRMVLDYRTGAAGDEASWDTSYCHMDLHPALARRHFHPSSEVLLWAKQ